MRKSIHTPQYRSLVALMRRLREERGISQEAVARTLGITASQFSKWERWERRVDLWELRLYSQAIGVELSDVVGLWEAEIANERD